MAAVEPLMSDVVVVGAGLCGLALARTLTGRGLNVRVVDARDRVGGRALTTHCEHTGQAVDLGPVWFWPETEPRIAALIDAIGLDSFLQHDPGDALWLDDPNRAPERRQEAGGVHVGARRIAGGTAHLVEALAGSLGADKLRLGTAVLGLQDRGNHIELRLSTGATWRARSVVLALPPRLVDERLRFEPPLSDRVQQALRATPTWMATQAKSVTTFDRPFWREAGHSGNAFVRHPQAVLGEVFDVSEGGGGALGGFAALSPAQRDTFRRSLPLLIESQLGQLYGAAAQAGTLHWLDWSQEPWTCSQADLQTLPEPPQADPLLRQPLWGGRLWLGGSETAAHGAGHMEGALESADRIAHALLRQPIEALHPAHATGSATTALHLPKASEQSRVHALRCFSERVQALRERAPDRYRQHLTRLLASHQHEQLTQRALLATVDLVYSEALAELDAWLPALDAAGVAIEQGRHGLTAQLLGAFEGWNKALLDAALTFNAGSCALSNFPDDHQPDAELLQAIGRDLAAAWREFALELNARLLAQAAELQHA